MKNFIEFDKSLVVYVTVNPELLTLINNNFTTYPYSKDEFITPVDTIHHWFHFHTPSKESKILKPFIKQLLDYCKSNKITCDVSFIAEERI